MTVGSSGSWTTRARHHGKRLHGRAFDLRDHGDGLIAHEVDLAGDEVVHRGRDATIGNVLRFAPIAASSKRQARCDAEPTPALP